MVGVSCWWVSWGSCRPTSPAPMAPQAVPAGRAATRCSGPTARRAACRTSSSNSPPSIRTSPSWSRSARRCRARTSSPSRCPGTPAASVTAAGRRRSTSALSTPASGSRRRWCAASPTTSSTATAPIPTITDLVDTTELWFVPVANPDGYDYTFTPGNRLWRKNLRDNDGDGRITANDGVDLNRNFPTKWGYDDEGSSPEGGSRHLSGIRSRLGARDPGARPADGAGRLRVPRQLPLRLRGGAVRHQLAGGHTDARRRPLRDARGRRRGARGARLRPGSVGRPLHRQRPHRRARPPGLRHARVDRRDEHLPDGRRGRPRRRVGSRRVRQHPRVPRRRGAGRGRVPQEPAVRPVHRPVGRRPGRPGDRRRVARRPSSWSTASTCPTATPRRWP